MDFIEFLKDKKLNGEDVYFKNNQFICNGKVYFSVKKIKKILIIADSDGQATKYKVIILKNSTEWHISQIVEGRPEKLSGYRIKINNDKVELYFIELSKDEKKWKSPMFERKIFLIKFFSVPLICLWLIILLLIFN